MTQPECEQFRFFLKDSIRKMIDFTQTDQHKGIPAPVIQKTYPADAHLITLSAPSQWKTIGSINLLDAISNRRSRRVYQDKKLSSEELSFLLWATQGIQHITGPATALRTVPSAGCRHAFETYVCVVNVENLKQGIYRYLPIEHALIEVSLDKTVSSRIVQATFNQSFIGHAAVSLIWAAIPYRMEWRYHLAAHKVIALDAGHVCQNLYLACEAIGCGCCAIGAYDQDLIDELIEVDGKDEFAIYLASVGKIAL